MSKKNPVRKGSDDVQESPKVAWTNGIVQIILRLVDKLPNESADRLNFGVDILAFLVLFFLGFYQVIPLEQVAPCFFWYACIRLSLCLWLYAYENGRWFREIQLISSRGRVVPSGVRHEISWFDVKVRVSTLQ
ncbi:hypothetical protein [Pseudomonas sichuanensis]|uniref:Uncharacterized protein n=1 Tax=Pseudomonas sichuanensis TaxID=2213015 RepID=A0ABV0D9J2_9PSED